MNKKAINALRRVVSSVLFFVAGVFIIANLSASGLITSPVIEVVLTVAWAALWNATALHNLFYRSVVAHRTLNLPAQPTTTPDEILGLRRSSHSRIKAIMSTSTAVAATAMDLYKIQQPTIPHQARLVGSLLWVGLGVFEIWLAEKHERKQENRSGVVIKPCGLRPSNFHVAYSAIFLSIGVSYAIAVWLDMDQTAGNPDTKWMKPIPNICWLTGGVNEITRTLQILIEDLIASHQSTVTVEDVTDNVPEVDNTTNDNVTTLAMNPH